MFVQNRLLSSAIPRHLRETRETDERKSFFSECFSGMLKPASEMCPISSDGRPSMVEDDLKGVDRLFIEDSVRQSRDIFHVRSKGLTIHDGD